MYIYHMLVLYAVCSTLWLIICRTLSPLCDLFRYFDLVLAAARTKTSGHCLAENTNPIKEPRIKYFKTPRRGYLGKSQNMLLFA